MVDYLAIIFSAVIVLWVFHLLEVFIAFEYRFHQNKKKWERVSKQNIKECKKLLKSILPIGVTVRAPASYTPQCFALYHGDNPILIIPVVNLDFYLDNRERLIGRRVS